MTEAFEKYDSSYMPGAGLTDTELLADLALPSPSDAHPMDGQDVRKRFRLIYGFWTEARAALAAPRADALTDHEYFDNRQWRAEDAAELAKRGQLPLVFNNVSAVCDWLIGTEKRSRVDWRILPRRAEDSKLAEVKTELLKYISDANDVGFRRSLCFRDAIISGLGWAEIGVREVGGADEEPVFYRYRDWRNIWHDYLAKDVALSDARYLHDASWVDLDIACAMFPDRADIIRRASNAGGTYYGDFDGDDAEDRDGFLHEAVTGLSRRSRVRIVTTWYKIPESVKVFRGTGTVLDGAVFDPANEHHAVVAESGFADIADTFRMSTRVMFWVHPPGRSAVLLDMRSPYRHNMFPYVPFFGKRRLYDGSYYGIVRGIRDIQDDLNKRRSKALFLMSSKGVMYEDGAFDDEDAAAEEVARPDMFLKYRKGHKVDLKTDFALASGHVDLMNEDKRYIEDIVGGSGEALGRETNAASGRAILARQEQGTVRTVEFFDNLRWSVQHSGRLMLSLIEQFYSDPKVLRIVGHQGEIKFEEINRQGENGETVNDITSSCADFIVDSQNYSATIRQAMFAVLGDVLTRLDPSVAMQLLDLWFDLSDLPGKDELVRRMRKLTGQQTDGDENDPKKQEELRQKQEAEAKQAAIQEQMIQLEIAEKQGKIERDRAEVQAKMAGIQFDAEKLKIERAKAASDIESARKYEHIEKAKTAAKIEEAALKTKSADKKGQGPYREKGMVSNNE